MKTIETMCREVGGVPSAAGGVHTVPPESPSEYVSSNRFFIAITQRFSPLKKKG